MAEPREAGGFWAAIALIGVLSVLAAGLLSPFSRPVEPSRPLSLKQLATAQADFRANDRDGNGRQDFWRGDVAGLYALIPEGEEHPLKLIELSTAAADARPLSDLNRRIRQQPMGGFWVRAIRNAGEDPATLDPDRFAFCAYPDDPSEHRWMFIVNERNTIFRAPAVKGGTDVFPDDATLKATWSELN